DLTSDESTAAGLRRVRERHGGRIASVIHLAAHYDLSGGPSPLYDKVTVQGTARLLRGLGFEVGQFVFSSTMLVHAPTGPGRPITEDSPLDPRWAYPESKVRTEALLRAEHGNIPVVLLRTPASTTTAAATPSWRGRPPASTSTSWSRACSRARASTGRPSATSFWRTPRATSRPGRSRQPSALVTAEAGAVER
ncbi:MAG: NAD-dependent epimerase/dehydratase family protein, partial [Acetobacteraceae bacterium]|nr:NAD-dependent epimerase/dehydratase family protein [Acetobacteraceae bacterium]